ncbi:hypothetical protein ACFL6U_28700 [Planctomycetota bacterium]
MTTTQRNAWKYERFFVIVKPTLSLAAVLLGVFLITTTALADLRIGTDLESIMPKPVSGQVNPADQWVATDALGRKAANYGQVQDVRPGKLVGLFYYVWVGNHTQTVLDITEILKAEPGQRPWGKEHSFHFWGEPEYGYYHASDPWVIRRDMQMLTNAGIDFIFFDVTNALTYSDTVKQVLKTSAQMRQEGIRTPAVCFLTNSRSGRTMNKVYDEIYGPSLHPELWFRWQGKPLIMGRVDDPELRPEVKAFFTIKRSWAWTRTQQEPDHWQWLDRYPQDYGWSQAKDIPEQITVSVAHHPQNPLGKSYHQGQQPPVNENYLTPFTGQGLQFEEQWSRAHEVDPQVVMITQWNEWIAQRFIWDKGKGSYAGHPIQNGDSYFVDVFTREFNRDIAPMKGGYTDNYYYQLISHVRKFKGMQPPQVRPTSRTIKINGKFDDWEGITTVHYDPAGDTLHRDFRGTDPKTIYTNTTGRNDIIESRVVQDSTYVYFQVKTRDVLSPHTDPHWMLLFIDTDQDKRTGWEGYDLLLNRSVDAGLLASVEKWNGQGWKKMKPNALAYADNQLELGVPLGYFDDLERGFDFKWADNPQHLEDVTAFFLDGDAAPDRRFNFRY